MEKEIYEVIRNCLNRDSSLTQKGLAEVLNVNPAAVNRMLHGMRLIKAHEIPIIERYIGARLDLTNKSVSGVTAMQAVADVMRGEAAGGNNHLVKNDSLLPVYDENMNLIDEVERNFFGNLKNGIFALYIQSVNMEPRYMFGELIYLQKGRPPEKHGDCFVEMKEGGNMIGRFISADQAHVKIQQLNPDRIFEIDIKYIASISAVIGRN